MPTALLLALAIVGSLGCTMSLDDESDRDPYNSERAAPAHVDDAVALIREEWSARLDIGIGTPPPVIRWFVGECLRYAPAYSRAEWNDGCILGRFVSKLNEVHAVFTERVVESELAHELLHWSLLHTSGDSDSAHVSPIWDEVDDVHEDLLLAEGDWSRAE
jgi:hypothetical protein